MRVVGRLLRVEGSGATNVADVIRLASCLKGPHRDLWVREAGLIEVENHLSAVLVVHCLAECIYLIEPTSYTRNARSKQQSESIFPS